MEITTTLHDAALTSLAFERDVTDWRAQLAGAALSILTHSEHHELVQTVISDSHDLRRFLLDNTGRSELIDTARFKAELDSRVLYWALYDREVLLDVEWKTDRDGDIEIEGVHVFLDGDWFDITNHCDCMQDVLTETVREDALDRQADLDDYRYQEYKDRQLGEKA